MAFPPNTSFQSPYCAIKQQDMNVENIMGLSICRINTSLFYILWLSISIAAKLLRQWMDIMNKRRRDITVTIDIIVSNV